MAVLDKLPNDERVTQVGLYSDSIAEIETLTKRVTRFNHRHYTSVILDIEPVPNTERANITLTFPNRGVQDKFWME